MKTSTHNKQSTEKVKRYRKTKLLPEVITAIKHALSVFETTELRIEKQMALSCFSHDDYFLVLYVNDKRKRVRKPTTTKREETI